MNFLKNNALLLLYIIMLSFLFIGLYEFSGYTYFSQLFIHIVTFVGLYIIFKNLIFKKIKFCTAKIASYFDLLTSKINKNLILYLITILFGAFVLGHWIMLGHAPFYSALLSWDYKEITWLRRYITLDQPDFWNYGTLFFLKAIIPVALLFSYIRKQKTNLFILLVLSLFYGLFTMQKSFFITLYLPLIIYTLLNKKIYHSLSFMLLPVVGILLLVITTNPSIKYHFISSQKKEKAIVIMGKSEDKSSSEPETNSSKAYKSVFGVIGNRLMIVPGEMVYIWFKYIPNDLPFLEGCGYRILAELRDCDYREYAFDLYPLARANYVKRGYIGSLNVASFMYDYANFGRWGLFYSGLFLALILVSVESFFDDYKMLIALNAFYILMLSSSALTTLMLSGGWGVMIPIYLLFRNESLKQLNN